MGRPSSVASLERLPKWNWREGLLRLCFAAAALYWAAALTLAWQSFEAHRIVPGAEFTIHSDSGFVYTVRAATQRQAAEAVDRYVAEVQTDYAPYAAVDMDPIVLPDAVAPRSDLLAGGVAAAGVLLKGALVFAAFCGAALGGWWICSGFHAGNGGASAPTAEARSKPRSSSRISGLRALLSSRQR